VNRTHGSPPVPPPTTGVRAGSGLLGGCGGVTGAEVATGGTAVGLGAAVALGVGVSGGAVVFPAPPCVGRRDGLVGSAATSPSFATLTGDPAATDGNSAVFAGRAAAGASQRDDGDAADGQHLLGIDRHQRALRSICGLAWHRAPGRASWCSAA
jgi:hypothetical protein